MKNPRSRPGAALALALGGLLLAGCAEQAPAQKQPSGQGGVDHSTQLLRVPSEEGEPRVGGTLRVGEFAEARSLDPTITYATGATGGNVMAALYDTLVRYDAVAGEYEPQLAKSLTVEEDSTRWTIGLREEARFSDGTPVDADAVVASLARYRDSHGLNAATMKQAVRTIEAVGSSAVRITLHRPWPGFANLLSGGPGMVLAPAAYADPASFEPIGAGPFVLQSQAPAEKTVVVANEDYWGGRPHLDRVEFVLPGSDEAGVEALDVGDLDLTFVRSLANVSDAIEADRPAMVSAQSLASIMWINTRKGRPGEDVRVRQAIALTMDPKLFLERTAQGKGMPTKSLIGSHSRWATGAEEPAVDPDRAEQLVQEAKADGFDGRITLSVNSSHASQAGGQTAKALLEAVGFAVDIYVSPSIADTTKKVYVENDFDLVVAAVGVRDEDLYGRLASILGSGSAGNVSGYSDPRVDELLTQLQGIEDADEARPVLEELEEIWVEQAPGVGLAAGAMVNTWSPKVRGVRSTSEATVLLDGVWLAE